MTNTLDLSEILTKQSLCHHAVAMWLDTTALDKLLNPHQPVIFELIDREIFSVLEGVQKFLSPRSFDENLKKY
jgi:hypothetical protein